MFRPYSAVLAATFCLAAPGLAFAHVTLETTAAPAGSTYKAILRVPHGCAGSPTTSIRVQIPEGVRQAKPMPKAGWTLTVKKHKLAQPYDWYGTKVEEDVSEIDWSGGNLPDAFYDEFIFRATLPEDEGKTIRFPVIQTCAKGQEKWIEIPANGQDDDSVESPAPGVKLGKKSSQED
ncbi:MAG: DUF1775 domain-containing protein [Rhodospirillaceae bacterium]|nr:MAG: DUF1775 domain-containing protein [Rhodospirillaceae bacterium]